MDLIGVHTLTTVDTMEVTTAEDTRWLFVIAEPVQHVWEQIMWLEPPALLLQTEAVEYQQRARVQPLAVHQLAIVWSVHVLQLPERLVQRRLNVREETQVHVQPQLVRHNSRGRRKEHNLLKQGHNNVQLRFVRNELRDLRPLHARATRQADVAGAEVQLQPGHPAEAVLAAVPLVRDNSTN